MTLPTFLPLPEAAEKFGLTEAELRQRVEAGTIAAGKLPDGEIVVSRDNVVINGTETDINDRLRAIKREDYEYLRGQGITVTEAAEKYGVKYGIAISRVSIWDWVKREYIKVLKSGYRSEIDEADIAYCAAVHTVRKNGGSLSGAPLFGDDGNPYLLKHPALSSYRRKWNQAKESISIS